MKLYFREYGKGKPIIIAHGLFGMSDNWIPIAKQLSGKFKVYLLDMRNHGQSPHSDVHNYNSMSDDLFEFTKELKISKAIFIGHSMGGKVVMQFANNYPDKIEQMIIVDISPKKYKYDKALFIKAINHNKVLKNMKDANIEKMKSRMEISVFFKTIYEDEFIIQLIQKNIKRNTDKSFSWKLNVESLTNNFKEIAKEIAPFKQSEKIKSLFIFGNESPYFSEKNNNSVINNFPEAIIKTIPNSGHNIHIDNKEKLTEEIKQFIN